MIPLDVPVDPEPPEATEWLLQELAKPAYQAAQPTLFDRIAKAIADWLASLELAQAQGPPALGIAVIVVLVVAGLIVAFLIFGLPRLNRRGATAGTLFGNDENRTAARMRADAQAAADRGDYTTASAEMFRALARGLAERTIVTTTPGTTARGFAERAATAFSSHRLGLIEAARTFDDVRYLGRPGTRVGFDAIAELELLVRASKPERELVLS